jgi:hypothetical protein
VPPAGFAVAPGPVPGTITQWQIPTLLHSLCEGQGHMSTDAAKTEVGVPSKITSSSERKAERRMVVSDLGPSNEEYHNGVGI